MVSRLPIFFLHKFRFPFRTQTCRTGFIFEINSIHSLQQFWSKWGCCFLSHSSAMLCHRKALSAVMISWMDVFNLSVFLRDCTLHLMHIPHCEYQFKAWSSKACSAANFNRNHFFCFTQQNKSSVPKAKYIHTSTFRKRFSNLPNLLILKGVYYLPETIFV